VRIAAWNVEWFDALFDDAGRPQPDNGPSGRHGVTRREQLAGLTEVVRTLDADAILVVEAPDAGRRRSTVTALEAFAAHAGIRARRALIGFPNGTAQEIALLHDPDARTARHDPRAAPDAPRFDARFRAAPGDRLPAETVRFSKPPLELACRTARGRDLRLIGVHVKSKATPRARSGAALRRSARRNRRIQIIQSLRLRARIDAHLRAGDSLIVLGDVNDGPGLDDDERAIGRASVEIVMGSDRRDPALRLYDPHAAGRRDRGRGGRRRPRASSSPPRGAGCRRCSTSSCCRPTCCRRGRAGASGIRSTTAPAGAIPCSGGRCFMPPTTSR
jgi:endonuclease/exonuclease/phosphatase family metal-dependent hydrolase